MGNGKIADESQTEIVRKTCLDRIESDCFVCSSMLVFIVCMVLAFVFSVIAYVLILHKCNCDAPVEKNRWANDVDTCQHFPEHRCCNKVASNRFSNPDLCKPYEMTRYREMGQAERGWIYMAACGVVVVFFSAMAVLVASIKFRAVLRAGRFKEVGAEGVLIVFWAIIVLYAVLVVMTVFIGVLWLAGVGISMRSYGLTLYWVYFFSTASIFPCSILFYDDNTSRRSIWR